MPVQQIVFPLQFLRQLQGPLEADREFETLSDMEAHASYGTAYNGMVVACRETKRNYILHEGTWYATSQKTFKDTPANAVEGDFWYDEDEEPGVVGDQYFKGVLPSAPSDPQPGWQYVDSTDHGFYMYYDGEWQLIQTLSSTQIILLESGHNLLLEDGNKILMETV